MTYETKNAEILALFTATGKETPQHDSNMGRAVQILQTICDSQSHIIPEIETIEDWGNDAYPQDIQDENIANFSEIFQALEEIENQIGDDDFMLDFDGNEYRIIKDSAIWGIYVETIQELVEDCYDLNLDKIPHFVAFDIDWENTAKNCYADGYGPTFASYDGEESEAGGYWIFRTN